MDALPLVVNQQQLKLMQQAANQAIADLENQKQAGAFDSNGSQQEENLLTYGTDDYESARQLVQTIEQELQSKVQAWEETPETNQPVEISFNSYQIGLVRANLKRVMQSHEDAQPSADQSETQLLQDLLEQLPEDSPQEDAD
ncbi:MAG: hypothetical protein IGS54_14820 [Elainella sp. C42_A2020_010]|nr:hypothetical protein [Elainella sp. C42_A2020_010]RNJ68512.1 MAG: hypothetical protein EDM05_15560 [Leptolyngbya sp. IPPAS B-1204]